MSRFHGFGSCRFAAVAPVLACFLLLAGCFEPGPRTVRQEVAAADPGAAEVSLRRYGCIDCHMIPGVRGATALVGPPLHRFGERRYIAGRLPNETDNLVSFLIDPQRIKPGSAMPATGITTEEARNVAAYLYTLR